MYIAYRQRDLDVDKKNVAPFMSLSALPATTAAAAAAPIPSPSSDFWSVGKAWPDAHS
jgi:hypothetical protein